MLCAQDGLNGLWTDSEMTVEAVVDEESVASIGKALRRAAKLFQSEPSKAGHGSAMAAGRQGPSF